MGEVGDAVCKQHAGQQWGAAGGPRRAWVAAAARRPGLAIPRAVDDLTARAGRGWKRGRRRPQGQGAENL